MYYHTLFCMTCTGLHVDAYCELTFYLFSFMKITEAQTKITNARISTVVSYITYTFNFNNLNVVGKVITLYTFLHDINKEG